MKKHKLFTYGILKGYGKLIHKDYSINASMYNLGSFPAIIELGTNRQSIGDIIEITQADLNRFDKIEGVDMKHPNNGLYRRESINTPYGKCFIYIYNGDVTGLPPISKFDISDRRKFAAKRDGNNIIFDD